MPSTKYEGLIYPIHFLKNRGSCIRNNFSEFITKYANIFGDEMFLYALFATNKAKIILNGHFSCSFSDTMISKSIKKIGK